MHDRRVVDRSRGFNRENSELLINDVKRAIVNMVLDNLGGGAEFKEGHHALAHMSNTAKDMLDVYAQFPIIEQQSKSERLYRKVIPQMEISAKRKKEFTTLDGQFIDDKARMAWEELRQALEKTNFSGIILSENEIRRIYGKFDLPKQRAFLKFFETAQSRILEQADRSAVEHAVASHPSEVLSDEDKVETYLVGQARKTLSSSKEQMDPLYGFNVKTWLEKKP